MEITFSFNSFSDGMSTFSIRRSRMSTEGAGFSIDIVSAHVFTSSLLVECRTAARALAEFLGVAVVNEDENKFIFEIVGTEFKYIAAIFRNVLERAKPSPLTDVLISAHAEIISQYKYCLEHEPINASFAGITKDLYEVEHAYNEKYKGARAEIARVEKMREIEAKAASQMKLAKEEASRLGEICKPKLKDQQPQNYKLIIKISELSGDGINSSLSIGTDLTKLESSAPMLEFMEGLNGVFTFSCYLHAFSDANIKHSVFETIKRNMLLLTDTLGTMPSSCYVRDLEREVRISQDSRPEYPFFCVCLYINRHPYHHMHIIDDLISNSTGLLSSLLLPARTEAEKWDGRTAVCCREGGKVIEDAVILDKPISPSTTVETRASKKNCTIS